MTGHGSLHPLFPDRCPRRQVYYAQRLSDGTVLRVSNLQYTVWVLVLQILQPVALVLFVALILALFLAGRLSRQIIEPINALDLQHPETAKTYDELSPLLSKIRSQNAADPGPDGGAAPEAGGVHCHHREHERGIGSCGRADPGPILQLGGAAAAGRLAAGGGRGGQRLRPGP